MTHFSTRLSLAAGAVATVLALAPAVAFAQKGALHVRGAISANDGKTITVKSREGDSVKIAMPEKVRISGLTKADLGSVKAGSYIGTAAMPLSDGSLVAQELLIFPPRMKGVGEGHRPWDLTPRSTMTNATVESVVSQVKGRVLKLKYKGGEKSVLVPPEAPIVTIVKADKGMLKPGANVFVVARKQPDGSMRAIRVAVGKDGLVPPM